jgi:hypothetical protein
MQTKAFLAALTTSFFALTAAAIAQDTRPGGFFSMTAPNDDMGGGVADVKKAVADLNKVLAAESMPLVEYKPTDLCYIGFYYQDDQGRFSSYVLNPKSFPFRYTKVTEGTCTFDAAKREETCQTKSLDGPQTFRTIYPHDNFTDAADSSSPEKIYNYVACDSEAANLRRFMQEAGTALGRGDLYRPETAGAAPFVRAITGNPQVFEAIKKHINEF